MKTLERVGTGGGSESGGDKHLYPRTLLDLCEKLTGSYDSALLRLLEEVKHLYPLSCFM